MIGIFLHGTAFYREFIYSAGADRRGCLTTQNNALGKFLVVFQVFMRTIVETCHVHHSCHVIIHYSIRSIHTLGYRTRRILTVADVLKHAGKFRATVSVPLVGNLIAYTPHHDTRIVAVMTDQIHQVLLYPFIKYLVISVLHLGTFPFIERFCHHHHTHLITGTDQFGSRHVMRSTDGIATHIFQNPDLAADTCLIGYTTQRPQVVVVAHSSEFRHLPVQKESFVRNNLQRTDTETGRIFIFQHIPLIYLGLRRIEYRRVGRPQRRVINHKILVEESSIQFVSRPVIRSQHLAVRSFNLSHDAIVRYLFSFRHYQFRFHVDSGKSLFHHRSSHYSAPHRNVYIFINDQMYVTVKSRPRIPTGRFRFVLQTHGKRVHFIRFQIRGSIYKEGVIAIGPIARFLPIDIDTGMAHGAVEHQGSLFPCHGSRSLEIQAIPSHTDKRQASGTSGMFHRLFLPILGNGHVLLVVVDAERTVDSPIMRHCHRLPFGIIIILPAEILTVLTGKLPSFLEGLFRTYLRLKQHRYSQQRNNCKFQFSFHIITFYRFLSFQIPVLRHASVLHA